MNKLAADLSNGITKNIYILHGEQAYLRNQYRDKLVNLFIPDGDTLNYAYFQGDDIDLNEIISLADTVPFLAEKRVIVVENSRFFESANDEIEAYIPNVPESTVLIFSEGNIDGRLKTVKTIREKGCVADFSNISDSDLRKWIMKKASEEKVQITNRALELFLDNCGTDMLFIQLEFDKLVAYTMERGVITPEDVEAICTVKIEDKIFLMMDAMFSHDLDKAMKYYGDLIALHQKPSDILRLIEDQLRLLLHVRQLYDEHHSEKTMVEVLKMHEYRVKKALPQARKSSKIWIMKGLALCAEIEEAGKVGNINHQIGLETIICTLSETVG